jgi:transposase
MNQQKKQKYTQKFKQEAVKLVTEQGYQVAEAAQNLGIDRKPARQVAPGVDR